MRSDFVTRDMFGKARNIFVLILSAILLWPMFSKYVCAASPDHHNDNVKNLIDAEHWKRARALLEPEFDAHHDDAETLYLLAQVKVAFNKYDEALKLAQQAVALDHKNSNYHLELGIVYGELASRANFLSARSLAIKFRKEVGLAIELDPGNLEALNAMMQFKYRAPSLIGGSKEEARVLALRIEQLDSHKGYLALADLARLEHQQAQVEAYLLKAVQTNPECYTALTSLAEFDVQSTKYDEAIKYAQYALSVDGTRVEAYWILARSFAHQQRRSDLSQTLALSANAVPDDLRPFYEAAQGLLDVGADFAEAEDYAKRYLSEEPEAEEPDSAEAHLLLGRVLEMEGRNTLARLEVQTALVDRPDFKAAKLYLKRLDN